MPSPASSALRAMGRFNERHPWSHNDIYAWWVLRQARRVRRAGGTRALDVGCGTGNLLRRLARAMPSVTGLEPDARAFALARANVAGLPNVDVQQTHFSGHAGREYDLITFVAVLHHLPLRESLRTAHDLLSPGGRLVVVGVAREAAGDRPFSLLSLLLNPIIGLVKHPHRAVEVPEHMTAPATPARETFDEIVQTIRGELQGATIRRGLFWRYTATWRRPPR